MVGEIEALQAQLEITRLHRKMDELAAKIASPVGAAGAETHGAGDGDGQASLLRP